MTLERRQPCYPARVTLSRSRVRLYICAAMGCLVSACAEPSSLRLGLQPDPAAATMTVVHEAPQDTLRVLVLDVRGGMPPVQLTGLSEGARIWVLQHAASVEALGLTPGEVSVVTQGGRPLPPALSVARSVVGSADGFEALPDLEPPLTDLQIPIISAATCAQQGGCFLEADAAICNLPCPEPNEPAAPAPVLPPVAPNPANLGPCPANWSETTETDGLSFCRPAARLSPETCLPGTWQPLYAAGCVPHGPRCPLGDWPGNLPSDRPVLYVRPGASQGDGSQAAPFGTIAQALASAPAGALLALSKGTFDGQVVLQTPGITLFGACVAQTHITGAGTDLITVEAENVTVQNLSVAGPRTAIASNATGLSLQSLHVQVGAFSGIYLAGGQAELQDVRISGGPGRGLIAAQGARLTARGLSIERSAAGVVLDGAQADLTDLAITEPRVSIEDTGRGLVALNSHFTLNRFVVARADESGAELSASTATISEGYVVGPGNGTTGVGLSVLAGSEATLHNLVVEDGAAVGISVRDSRAVAQGMVVRGTPRTVPEQVTAGLQVVSSDFAGQALHLSAGASAAAYIQGPGRVRLSDTMVVGAGWSRDPEDSGVGLYLGGAIDFESDRLSVVGSDARLIIARGAGANITFRDTQTVLRTEDPDSTAVALTVMDAPKVTVQRFSARGPMAAEVIGPNAELYSEDFDAQAEAHVGGYVLPALNLRNGQCEIHRLRCRGPAVSCVLGWTSSLNLYDVDVQGAYTAGIEFAGPYPQTLQRARIQDVAGSAVRVRDGAWATIQDLRVVSSLRQSVGCGAGCAGSALMSEGSGFWELAAVPSRVDLERFAFESGQDVALDLRAPAEVSLRDGRVRGFGGAVRTLGPRDLGPLIVRVRYEQIGSFVETIER